MKVIAKKNRELALINAQNTQNENRAETITLVVPEEYEDYNKKIVFVTDDGTVWDVITNNEYKITNAITKYKQVDFYIWLTKEVDGESIDFRTKTKTLSFYHNEDASDEITDEEIHGVNTVVNILEEEITKVDSLETELRDLITDIQNKLDNGEFDGEDGYTPQKGIDYFTEQDIEEIETDVKNDLEENVLVNYSLIAETGAKIELSINQTNYKLTAILKDKNNNIIHTSNVIDLPLETMVVNATYDNTTKKIILTLQNGTTVEFSVADLVSGLVSETQLQTILANYYTQTEINNLLANKVDKVAGKGLSTNDFTDEYKEQVDTNTEDIEKLQTENARLKATLPTTGEVTGQAITLDKTAELEFKKPPLPMGNSEQDGEPSPDNEVPITNVTGDVEVVVENANIWDEQWELGGINPTTGDITISSSVIRSKNFITVKPSTEYYFKNETDKYWVYAYDKDKNYIGYAFGNTSSIANTVKTTLSNCYFLKFQCRSEYGTTYNNDICINVSNTTLNGTYVPHKQQTFTFPLGNEKLMLGDYLADDGIHHVRGQVVYNGTEEIFANTSSGDIYAYIIPTSNKKRNANVLSNYFKQILEYNSAVGIYSGAGLNVCIKDITNVNDFKTWLSTHNTTVEYELEEEVIVPYTSAQQTVYNQIKQALSYEEQTNISSNQNALFSVEAYLDSKEVIDEKYTKPSTGIPKTDLASAVQTSLGKADTALQEHQDISGKQDITDNTLTTINKTVPTAINEVNSIAKLANQAKSYSTYQAFINYLNTAEKTEFIPGQSFMIQTKLVPDLWVYSVENTSVQYTYTTDEDFITYTNQATGGQVGYYKLAQLETQKVDLTDYATKTYVNNLFNSIVDGDEVSY